MMVDDAVSYSKYRVFRCVWQVLKYLVHNYNYGSISCVLDVLPSTIISVPLVPCCRGGKKLSWLGAPSPASFVGCKGVWNVGKMHFNKVCSRRVRPTRYAPARVQEPNFRGRYSWPWQVIAHAPVEHFEVCRPLGSIDMIHFWSQQ